MIDEDETPETSSAKTDQGAAVPNNPKEGWRNKNNTLVYQTLDDAKAAWDGRPARIFIVVDPDQDVFHNGAWPTNDQWYYGETLGIVNGRPSGLFMPLHFWLKTMYPDQLKKQLATPELLEVAKFSRKFVTKEANDVPVFKPDTSLSNERPTTQKSSTASKDGTAVETSITTDPKKAGPVTASNIISGAVKSGVGSLDAAKDAIIGSVVSKATSLLDDKLGAFGGIGAKIEDKLLGKLGSKSNLPPCLPNTAPGVGSTVTKKISGPDAAIAELRAKAAETVSTNLDAFGGAGPKIGAPGADPTKVKPQTVTLDASPNERLADSANPYKYEPLKAGFDRYDFNTGKKVVTP